MAAIAAVAVPAVTAVQDHDDCDLHCHESIRDGRSFGRQFPTLAIFGVVDFPTAVYTNVRDTHVPTQNPKYKPNRYCNWAKFSGVRADPNGFCPHMRQSSQVQIIQMHILKSKEKCDSH